MEVYFNHEKLDVYQEAIAFVSWWAEIRPRCSGAANVQDQLDRASTSTPLNIAEGNGRFTVRDRSHYFRTASASALECAACLDVLVARRSLAPQDIPPGKEHLRRIVSMTIGLIKSDSDRVGEPDSGYDVTSHQRGQQWPDEPDQRG